MDITRGTITGYQTKKINKSSKVILNVKIKDFTKLSMSENPKRLKRGIIVKVKEPLDFIDWVMLFLEYADVSRGVDVFEYSPKARRLKRLKPNVGVEEFFFGSFSYNDFLHSVDKLITQDNIYLSGERITVLDRDYGELDSKLFSIQGLIRKEFMRKDSL